MNGNQLEVMTPTRDLLSFRENTEVSSKHPFPNPVLQDSQNDSIPSTSRSFMAMEAAKGGVEY